MDMPLVRNYRQAVTPRKAFNMKPIQMFTTKKGL